MIAIAFVLFAVLAVAWLFAPNGAAVVNEVPSQSLQVGEAPA